VHQSFNSLIETIPEGPYFAEDAKKIFPPTKGKIMSSMEELIQNFMITTQGPQMPAGEVYFEAENPNVRGALSVGFIETLPDTHYKWDKKKDAEETGNPH
jgi:NADH:ubiquinone oxidoreductase subunit D